MPKKMNLIDACAYKLQFPSREVVYMWRYSKNPVYLAVVEELIIDEEELKFVSADGEYPSQIEESNYGKSHFYARHIFGDILCETAEEEANRYKEEEERLNQQIQELVEKKKELAEQTSEASVSVSEKKPPAEKIFYEICFLNPDTEKEWLYFLPSLKALTRQEVRDTLKNEHIGNEGLTVKDLDYIKYIEKTTAYNHQLRNGLQA